MMIIVSIGKDKLTYKAFMVAENMIYLENDHTIKSFNVESRELKSLTSIADVEELFKQDLDHKGDHTFFYDGEEFLVYNVKKNECVWRKKLITEERDDTMVKYHCKFKLSNTGRKLLYRVRKNGYNLVDLATGEDLEIENKDWHTYFSNDDKYLGINDKYYNTETGEVLENNPFPFAFPKHMSHSGLPCDVLVKDNLIIARIGSKTIEVWDYEKGELLATISDPFIVKNTNIALTKNNLILHTDCGVVSVYNFTYN